MERTAVAAGLLRSAVNAKFGAGSAQKLQMHQPGPEDLAKVDKATETIDADKATVTMQEAPGQSVQMKLVKVNGLWKVAVASMLPPLGDEAAKEALRGMGNFADALEATAKDVEAGKFATLQETNGAIEARLLSSMVPSTQPTTAPAIGPARP